MYANLSSIQAGGNLASFVPQNGRIILIDCSNNITSYTGKQSSRLYNNYLIGDGVTTCANLTLNSFDEEDVLKQYVISVHANLTVSDEIRTDTTFSEIIQLNEDGYNIICNVNNGEYIAYLNSISSSTIKFVFEDPNTLTTYTINIDDDDSVALIINKVSNSIQSITEYTQSIDVSVNDSYDTAISKLRKIIIEDEYISAAALNDLNDNKADKTELPTKLSELVNDSNYIASLKTVNNINLTGTGNVTIGDVKYVKYNNGNMYPINGYTANTGYDVNTNSLTPTLSDNRIYVDPTGSYTIAYIYDGSGFSQIVGLPPVSSSDNGKVLKVVNGQWALVSPVTIYSGSGSPDNTEGNNGDIYLQIS